MKRQFILIGIDDHPRPQFTAEVRQHLGQGRVFSGGTRHYELVRRQLPAGHKWIPITVPLSAVLARYDQCFARACGPIVVFASGDPLFFGFANTLMREMPDADLRIYPAFNSLQTLAHRIPMRYDDLRIVSLTGRPWQELDAALMERAAKIGVLTDRTHTPAAIAARLLDYGYTYYNMYVGEHLGGGAREKVSRLSLQEAARTEFAAPNCLILQADAVPPRTFGIPDEAFEHLDGRSRMITKMPIRLLALQAMDLPSRRVLWDVGFCTGSVSIEARLQFPHLEVFAFEIRPECEELMRTNSRRLGAPGIHVLMGDFLRADVSRIPPPDAVFIGGHGGRLKKVLQRVREVLPAGGCVVFNSVSPDSRALFEEGLRETGMRLCRSTHIAVDDYNPITLLKAVSDDPRVTRQNDPRVTRRNDPRVTH